MRSVVVIGAGITGLAAAHRLLEEAARRETPLRLTVIEASARAGGAIHTIRAQGFVIEAGVDSFISEKPWGVSLAKRIGLESELIGTQEQFRKTYVVRAGRLEEIPLGFMLIAPTRVGPVLKSRIFSPLGKLRMALEVFLPRRRESGDESLGSFVERRLGREALERLVQPLAGGIYTADPAVLSLEATMPRFLELERRHRSLILGLRAAQSAIDRNASGARLSLFVSFKGGMQFLIDKLTSRLGEGCVRLRSAVTSLARDDDARWRVTLANGEIIAADAVICTASAPVAAKLIEPHDTQLAERLRAIVYNSSATVNLAYRMSDFPRAPDGFGFVVPAIENRKIIACSFSSLKFAQRAPEGAVLARTFLGGALQRSMMSLSDAEMIEAAREEMRSLMNVVAEPILTHVERWPDSMPQYAVGHLERVAEIGQRAAALPMFALAGAAYRGVGLPDCVHSGELAAESILSRLNSTA
ncbi:MAG TPA: protoporphyrinogen oxidase [Candidatus Binataceae bacterium]|nr:protoporphyrinogen oxidase [Candidatus Binataceae bacterium]